MRKFLSLLMTVWLYMFRFLSPCFLRNNSRHHITKIGNKSKAESRLHLLFFPSAWLRGIPKSNTIRSFLPAWHSKKRPMLELHGKKYDFLALTLIGFILGPRPALAACNTFDLSGCITIAEYNMWNSMAVLLWQIDRMLLQASYYIDHLRWWMVTQAFQHSYDAVRVAVEPLLTPMATLALMLALLLILCVPLFGRIDLINIRQVLVWLTLGPLLLLHAGPLLVEVESMRNDIGSALVTAAGLSLNGIFQPAEQPDEPAMHIVSLYSNASVCPNAQITRPNKLDVSNLRQDDMAAAFVLANAQDIHCPGTQSPDSTLPDRFFEQDGYAFNGDIVDSLDSPELSAAPQRMKLGAVRLALGIMPCLLAVMETLIQLLFAASLAMLWLLLPLLLLMLFFARDMRTLGELIRRVGQILTTSWVVSLLLGMISVALLAAARSGNASAYVALTLGGGYLILRMLRVALDTFSESLVGAGSLLAGTAGAAVVGASAALGAHTVHLSGKLLGNGAALLTGSQQTTQSSAAQKQSTSRRTVSNASGTAAGRIQLAAHVGALSEGIAEQHSIRPAAYHTVRSPEHQTSSVAEQGLGKVVAGRLEKWKPQDQATRKVPNQASSKQELEMSLQGKSARSISASAHRAPRLRISSSYHLHKHSTALDSYKSFQHPKFKRYKHI